MILDLITKLFCKYNMTKLFISQIYTHFIRLLNLMDFL